MAPSGWTLRNPETRPVSGERVFTRSLGLNEQSFYWDAQFNRTGDCIRHAIVETRADRAKDLFDEKNVSRTWVSLKQQFPLLGSHFEQLAEGNDVRFVVMEQGLRDVGPEEIQFSSITSLDEAGSFVDSLLNCDVSPELLSGPLAQLFILRRTDSPNYFHIVFRVLHAITDGISNINMLRTFLDILSSPVGSLEVPNLEYRLAMAVASDDLDPGLESSLSTRRWRRAIAYVLNSVQVSKRSGGQSLPRKFTPTTQFTPARSHQIVMSFPPETTARIIANCRKHQVTFGNAYHVLGQVALSRVLHRWYLCGDISEEEWEFRKREPMLTGSPMNLRPYLAKAWLDKGGSNEVGLSISFFFCKLPFMPSGLAATHDRQAAVTDDPPSLSDILSLKRFFHRCHLMKQQSARALKSPLFLELSAVGFSGRLAAKKSVWREWRNHQEYGKQEIQTVTAPWPGSGILSFSATTMGNIEALLPQRYPLSSTNSWRKPQLIEGAPFYNDSSSAQYGSAQHLPDDSLIHLHYARSHLRCKPGELYLSAVTINNQLHLNIYWDENVYKEETVQEWFEEIRNATEWYLGRE